MNDATPRHSVSCKDDGHEIATDTLVSLLHLSRKVLAPDARLLFAVNKGLMRDKLLDSRLVYDCNFATRTLNGAIFATSVLRYFST